MQGLVRLLFCVALVITTARAQTDVRDSHFHETASSVIFARSTFAHGYRHGYEAGYHLGNMDINMGRQMRTKPAQFHDVQRGYDTDFGPKKSFETGFQNGLKAGYLDGYVGHTFRAIDSLRMTAVSLSAMPVAADPRNLYFDEGFSSGYDEGLIRGQHEGSLEQKIDLRFVSCQFHPAKDQDLPAQDSYCEGYRRGYSLGHSDGIVIRPDHGSLEASRR